MEKKMKKLIVILLLSLSYCENMESNKKVEKQDPFNIALALRAVVVTQFPYPLAGSCSRETTNSKFCINGFSHSPHSCGEGLTNVGRCSAQNSVGVCVFYSLGSVSESVYYSPEFTQEQARQKKVTVSNVGLKFNKLGFLAITFFVKLRIEELKVIVHSILRNCMMMRMKILNCGV